MKCEFVYKTELSCGFILNHCIDLNYNRFIVLYSSRCGKNICQIT